MFIALQVQKEANSTIEKGNLAAALLCGKHHHTPKNHNNRSEGEKTSARIKETAIFLHSILPRWILQKTFPQHNSDISQMSCVISASVKNILYSVKNIFQEMQWNTSLLQKQASECLFPTGSVSCWGYKANCGQWYLSINYNTTVHDTHEWL